VELYHLTGDESLLSQSQREIDYLRRRGGWLITGSAGKSECWQQRSVRATANSPKPAPRRIIHRLFDTLLRMEGASVYGDMMERAIYNALFGAQSPERAEAALLDAVRRPAGVLAARHLLLPMQLPPHHRGVAAVGGLPLG
jgi:DUF1680 family protein